MTTLLDNFDFEIKRTLKVKKLHPDAVLPSRANESDAGLDCVAIADPTEGDGYLEYCTGLAIELPIGYHCELFPRSSISKMDLVLANSIGLVDNGYRGEIRFRFKVVGARSVVGSVFYKKGDKIGQIVVRKTENLAVEEVETLSDTQRGAGGFGSSGK